MQSGVVSHRTGKQPPPGVWFPWARFRSGEGTAGPAGMVDVI
ncbi:hypothetical protein Hsw_0413 [Hymenobacter swuensis DY53]|uniref:Uncharacterized protein n=1 Tax=Hymenobacter swuensis DY53 TaxID=1227739 RepID=W8EU34_9BACT|nr:hypothetical protein Hsw_0413 [Hymenobacter swuensis DY53]